MQVLHSPLLPLFPLLLLLCPSLPSPSTARGGQLPQLGGQLPQLGEQLPRLEESSYLPNWLRTLIAVDNKIQVEAHPREVDRPSSFSNSLKATVENPRGMVEKLSPKVSPEDAYTFLRAAASKDS